MKEGRKRLKETEWGRLVPLQELLNTRKREKSKREGLGCYSLVWISFSQRTEKEGKDSEKRKRGKDKRDGPCEARAREEENVQRRGRKLVIGIH